MGTSDKTADGWKLIDATGGGNDTSWDSENQPIPGAAGTNRGVPKQLFHQAVDLGEDHPIGALASDAEIRAASVARSGRDLLGVLDAYRAATADPSRAPPTTTATNPEWLRMHRPRPRFAQGRRR
ncbi:MAG: hypothetical protein R3F11_20265 [Verrucomicrobiales bacterium]